MLRGRLEHRFGIKYSLSNPKTQNIISSEDYSFFVLSFQWQEPVEDQLVNTISNTVGRFLDTVKVESRKEDVIPPTVSGVVEGSTASFPVGFGHAVRYVAPGVVLLG